LTHSTVREIIDQSEGRYSGSLEDALQKALVGDARHGDIATGVTLKRDRSTVRMTAVEPDFENTLPWLDLTTNDDRLIAALWRSCASIRTRPSCSSPAT
jgi:hypothetical protein